MAAARKLKVMDGPDEIVKAPVRKQKATRPTKAQLTAKAATATRKRVVSYTLGGLGLVGLGLSGYDSYHAIVNFLSFPPAQAAALAIIVDAMLAVAKVGVLFATEQTTKRWGWVYISMAGLLSVGLNAAEFAHHGTTTGGMLLRGIVGGIIPCMVLVASNYAGHLYLESGE